MELPAVATRGGRHRRPVELWGPCRLGHPDPENCPTCTPAAELRCPEYHEVLRGSAGNDPNEPLYVVRKPCRVLGNHDRHNDGNGMTWWPTEYEGRHVADDEYDPRGPCTCPSNCEIHGKAGPS